MYYLLLPTQSHNPQARSARLPVLTLLLGSVTKMLCKLLFLIVLSNLILAQHAPNDGKCGNPVIKPNVGNTNISDQVVGGTLAIPYSWPWQIVWCEGKSPKPSTNSVQHIN